MQVQAGEKRKAEEGEDDREKKKAAEDHEENDEEMGDIMSVIQDTSLANWLVKGMDAITKEGEREAATVAEIKTKQVKKWYDDMVNASKQLEKYGKQVQFHVSEVDSPPRLTNMADRMRMIPGYTLDLTANDHEDGKPWGSTT